MKITRSGGCLAIVVVSIVSLAMALPAGAATARSSPAAATGSASPADLTTPLSPTHLVIRMSTSSLLVQQKVTATIVVVPRAAGRVVSLQRQGATQWRNLAQGVTDRLGKVVLSYVPKTPAVYRLRGSVTETALNDPAISHTDILKVSPVPPPYAGAILVPGASGPQVVALQQRLTSLGYWVGTVGGYFGDATEQAVYAVQKAAGIPRTGNVDAATVSALQAGTLPTPRTKSGYVIEVDLKRDLVMFVNNGVIQHVLNTSTGGGYTYTQDGVTNVALTPTGIFHINRIVDGTVVDTLGTLWRPRFFDAGYALHGDTYVPPFPESHGCVRVSNEAIDWIWANNLAPVGTEVSVYG
jgi:peptidoglycan hydrolase-like protein with peptidoglycan-binding domain